MKTRKPKPGSIADVVDQTARGYAHLSEALRELADELGRGADTAHVLQGVVACIRNANVVFETAVAPVLEAEIRKSMN